MEQNKHTDIFQYNDYRQYLSDYYANKKLKNSSYSHRVFANQAGLSSPSHLLMIIKGERNLSLKTIPKFAEGLNLSAKEKRFFELLVLYNQAEDLQTKAGYFGEIMSIKAKLAGLHKLEKERFSFLSKWYAVAIYVLIDLKNFNPDPIVIAKRLGGKVSVPQIKETLETLLNLNLIVIDPKKGFKQAQGAVTVADDTKSMAVFEYHQSMIRLAAEALRRHTNSEREINGATIAIPKSKLPEIKEKIRAFRKEINLLASSYENPEDVFQLNIQLFPLTINEEK